jgi:hypothetical protein
LTSSPQIFSVYVVFLWLGGSQIEVTTECGPSSVWRSNVCLPTVILAQSNLSANAAAIGSNRRKAASAAVRRRSCISERRAVCRCLDYGGKQPGG